MTDLVQARRVYTTLNIGARTFYRLSQHKNFPAPEMTDKHGRWWEFEKIMMWLEDEGYWDPTTETFSSIRKCYYCRQREAS